MNDALRTKVNLHDTVVYIHSSYGTSSQLSKGVVTKINPKTIWVQPLIYQELSGPAATGAMIYASDYMYQLPGRLAHIRVRPTILVKSDRFVVVNGEDWPEYKLFLDVGVVLEPLDTPV